MLRAIIRVGWFFGVCVLSSLAAFGQANVINPKVVEFDPSADHSALTADGQPLVTRYDLQIFLQGATQPTTTTSLGKPAIETDGKIRVDFSTLITPWPLASGTYQARVEAIGPAGAGESDPSNLFVFQAVVTPPTPAPCTYALSSTAQAAVAMGGAASVMVTTSNTTCAWAASSNASWVTVGPSSGTGSGAVNVTVAANTGVARTAKVTIGGLTYTVSQAAAPPPCSFSLSPTSIVAAGPEGASMVSLTASAPTCAWTAQSSASWITVGTTSGTGSASVTCSLSRNTSGASRAGTVTVGGHAVTVTQASLQGPTQPQGLKVVIK
ncbi:MAG TPA: BACON domain-containing protein [Vicinamibacterales bacterium]